MPALLQTILDKPIAYEVTAYLSCCGAAFLLMYFIVLTDMSN